MVMTEQSRDGLIDLGLRLHERIVDTITGRYIQGPVPDTAEQDARRFFESKIRYLSARSDDIPEDEIKDCRGALRAADRGDWEPARRAILRSCRRFLEADDEELDETAIAFANLANSLPENPQGGAAA